MMAEMSLLPRPDDRCFELSGSGSFSTSNTNEDFGYVC
jgi:hypothetical protein